MNPDVINQYYNIITAHYKEMSMVLANWCLLTSCNALRALSHILRPGFVTVFY